MAAGLNCVCEENGFVRTNLDNAKLSRQSGSAELHVTSVPELRELMVDSISRKSEGR